MKEKAQGLGDIPLLIHLSTYLGESKKGQGRKVELCSIVLEWKESGLCLLAPPEQRWSGCWWKRAGRTWAWCKLVSSSQVGSSILGRVGQA